MLQEMLANSPKHWIRNHLASYLHDHSGFEKVLLHIAREVRPQCERGLAQQAFELERRISHHFWTTRLKRSLAGKIEPAGFTPARGEQTRDESLCRFR